MFTVVAAFVSCTLALAVRLAIGRLAALGVAAAGGGFIAYFLMPPVFSFRVSRTSDLVILACYGAVGFVLVRVQRNASENVDRQVRHPNHTPIRRSGTAVSPAVEKLLASDLGDLLSRSSVVMDLEPAVMPWCIDDMVGVLNAAISDAVRKDQIHRISVSGARRPGIRSLIVTAHRTWPPPLEVVILIGKGGNICDVFKPPQLPRNSRATWFDNGYGYTYQFTADEPGRRTLPQGD